MTSPVRTYAVAAVLAILAGAGVAYCQHQGDAPAPVDCSNVAYAVPAATKTKSTSKRTDTPPRREVRKDPRPVTSPSSSPPRRRTHIDLDLDMDGC